MSQGSNFYFFAALRCSHLEFNAFIAIPWTSGCKQGIKSKAGAIKCCKEIKVTAPRNEKRNIPFVTLDMALGPRHTQTQLFFVYSSGTREGMGEKRDL